MILVDMDKTLAHYTNWETNGKALGAPIPAMVERVKYWLAKGKDVRIFTARAHESNPRAAEDCVAIGDWTEREIGQRLPVQCWKSFEVEAIWDDLAVSVEANTGRIVRRLDMDVE